MQIEDTMKVIFINQSNTLFLVEIMSENIFIDVFIVHVILSASMEVFDPNT